MSELKCSMKIYCFVYKTPQCWKNAKKMTLHNIIKKIFIKPIRIFRLLLKEIDNRIHRVHYEEELISELIENLYKKQKRITIVQIGAYKGFTSNDHINRFITKHCNTAKYSKTNEIFILLIEPVRHIFNELVKNYKNYYGIVFENYAVAEIHGEKKFYMLNNKINLSEMGMPEWLDQLGSLLSERIGKLWENYEENKIYQKFLRENTIVKNVMCVTFDELIDKYNLKEIDLLQIDAEGYDYKILKSINFEKIKPKYINYERVLLQKQESACRNLLLLNNYRIHDHGQDSLCVLDYNISRFYRIINRVYNKYIFLKYII